MIFIFYLSCLDVTEEERKYFEMRERKFENLYKSMDSQHQAFYLHVDENSLSKEEAKKIKPQFFDEGDFRINKRIKNRRANCKKIRNDLRKGLKTIKVKFPQLKDSSLEDYVLYFESIKLN